MREKMAASRRILTTVRTVYPSRLCISSQMYVTTRRSIRCFTTSHAKEEEGPELPNGFLFNEKVFGVQLCIAYYIASYEDMQ